MQVELPQGADKLGVIGLLLTATIVLWRKLEKKDETIEKLTRELVENLALLKDLTGALERLRTGRKSTH